MKGRHISVGQRPPDLANDRRAVQISVHCTAHTCTLGPLGDSHTMRGCSTLHTHCTHTAHYFTIQLYT